MSGIPLTWQERQEPAGQPWNPATGSTPLIFAGGPSATSNPEPWADFFDFLALGDGEELLVEIGNCLRTCREESLDRDSTLFRLSTTVEGVYVPQFYASPEGFGGAVYPIRDGVPPRVRRRVCAPDPFQQIGLVPYIKTVHDRLTVEIRRGCTRGCRFCQPGMLTRPARDVDPQRAVDAVEHGLRTTVRILGFSQGFNALPAGLTAGVTFHACSHAIPLLCLLHVTDDRHMHRLVGYPSVGVP